MHSGVNCKNNQIIPKIYGRIGWIMVKYVSEGSQGFTQWRLDGFALWIGRDEYGYL